jgi:hypothetical protein
MNFKRNFHTADDSDLPEINICDGSVACLRMLDVVTFRDYYSPGVLFFLHTLLEGSSQTVMDLLQIAPRYFGGQYGDLVHDLICSRNLAPALVKAGTNQRDQLAPEDEVVTCTMVPLGLFRTSHPDRSYNKTGSERYNMRSSERSYVFTNPPPTTTIQAGDKVYVMVVSKRRKSATVALWRNAKVNIQKEVRQMQQSTSVMIAGSRSPRRFSQHQETVSI